MVKISVVLPVMNEVANIDPIYQVIKELLVANGFEYEVIFVCCICSAVNFSTVVLNLVAACFFISDSSLNATAASEGPNDA